MVYYDIKHQYDPNEFAIKNDDEIEIVDVKIEKDESGIISRGDSIVIGDLIPEQEQKSLVSETKKEDKSYRSLSSNTKNDVKMLMHDRNNHLI
jgi:hypothetical protein